MSAVVLVQIISGPEGNCLCISDEGGGERIAGPKPWGGGQIVNEFEVSVDTLQRAIEENKFTK